MQRLRDLRATRGSSSPGHRGAERDPYVVLFFVVVVVAGQSLEKSHTFQEMMSPENVLK